MRGWIVGIERLRLHFFGEDGCLFVFVFVCFGDDDGDGADWNLRVKLCFGSEKALECVA